MPPPPIVTDALLREAGRLSTDIGKRQSVHSPIIALMPKGIFESGMGVTQTAVLFQRGTATGGSGWQTVGTNTTDSLNSCNPTPAVVNAPSDLFPYYLQQNAFSSSYLCWNDIYTSFQAQEQVANRAEQLRDVVLDAWEDADRDNYIAAARNKAVFASKSLIPGATPEVFASVAADSTATPDMLAQVYQRIIFEGGAGAFDSAVGMADSQYVFPILMSAEQAAFLDKNDGQRNDIRWNDGEVGSLLKPWSTNRTRNGFMYMTDPKTPRYSFSGGVYTRIPFYTTTTSSSGGLQRIVNPAYLNAEYEDIIVFMKQAVVREMPKPTIATADASFRPQNFAGTVRWLNIPDQELNPLENTGRFYALLQAAYRWKNPFTSWVIKVRRCPFNIQTNTCSGT